MNSERLIMTPTIEYNPFNTNNRRNICIITMVCIYLTLLVITGSLSLVLQCNVYTGSTGMIKPDSSCVVKIISIILFTLLGSAMIIYILVKTRLDRSDNLDRTIPNFDPSDPLDDLGDLDEIVVGYDDI